MKQIIIFLLMGITLCFGCEMQHVKQVEALTPIEILPNEKARPIQFKKIVIKLERGAEYGTIYAYGFCEKQGPLRWRGGRVIISGDEFTDVFREELEKANYPIVGNPDALFDEQSEWKAELLVGGLVKEMQASLCYPMIGFGSDDCKGETYMKVDWQVYSRLNRSVVYKTSTEGSSVIETEITNGDVELFVNAFAVATQNLLADEGFHDLVVKAEIKSPEVTFEKLVIDKVEKYDQVITNHINKNRISVVTVFAGDGHGSGFFISENGYLLTNAHVIGGAKFVTVKLVTGREIIGEVVRKNEVRDVALIKVEESKMVPLPIRSESLNVGDKVFALGTPLKEDLDTTLSSGIVSAFRIEDDQRFIQSDVNILPGSSGGALLDENGNVVGMAVSTLNIRNIQTGLNFFIPIDEVLASLNIEISQ